ncbi:MAG TPA: hypothetical protein VD978_25930 [Azospirillum sp.]|nr:hypothetical protein [Azospirillum sp.]
MTTTTFSHTGTERTLSHGLQVIREFLIAWFQATPAYVLYRALTH